FPSLRSELRHYTHWRGASFPHFPFRRGTRHANHLEMLAVHPSKSQELPCWKKPLCKKQEMTFAKGSHHPPRRASLFMKRLNTYAKANTELARQSRQLQSD